MPFIFFLFKFGLVNNKGFDFNEIQWGFRSFLIHLFELSLCFRRGYKVSVEWKTMPLLKVNLLISKRIHPAVVPIERHLYHALVSALKSAGSREVWSVQSSDNEHTLEMPAGIIALARAHCSALDTGAAEWSENSLGREMQVGQAADKRNYGVNINQETNGSYPTETAGPKCWIALRTCAGWQSRGGDPDQNLWFCSRGQGDTFTTSKWPWLFWLSVPPRLASCSLKLCFHQQKWK